MRKGVVTARQPVSGAREEVEIENFATSSTRARNGGGGRGEERVSSESREY